MKRFLRNPQVRLFLHYLSDVLIAVLLTAGPIMQASLEIGRPIAWGAVESAALAAIIATTRASQRQQMNADQDVSLKPSQIDDLATRLHEGVANEIESRLRSSDAVRSKRLITPGTRP